ncbi:MAG: glycosyltransferase family 4 protein [Candidatus Zixiibacteriota bacterium]|nr:MAG: glycosyltransferase family 4 protein [candidate division Zixibacteria bacterium]
MKILVVINRKVDENIWWWGYIPPLSKNCQLDVAKIRDQRFLSSILPLLRLYKKLNKYDMVITQQDGYATFIIAFLNSLLRHSKCRHFINHFITKEKSASLYSRIKYMFLSFVLSSTYCIMCASKLEAEYYKSVLKLKNTQFRFVPLATDPQFLKINTKNMGDYIISSGRTGRDYKTLLEAVAGLPIRLIIVADYFNLSGLNIPDNVEIKYNIPYMELIDLTSSAKFVILPLQDRRISVGQSVLLEAMGLGKATIVTRNAATVDYVKDGETGIFVKPNDYMQMREAILYLLDNPQKADEIGVKARESVKKDFTIDKVIYRYCSVLKETLGKKSN